MQLVVDIAHRGAWISEHDINFFRGKELEKEIKSYHSIYLIPLSNTWTATTCVQIHSQSNATLLISPHGDMRQKQAFNFETDEVPS